MSGIKTLEDFRPIMSGAMGEAFDRHFGQKSETLEDSRTNGQRLARLEQDTRQPRPTMEADVQAETQDSQAHGGRL